MSHTDPVAQTPACHVFPVLKYIVGIYVQNCPSKGYGSRDGQDQGKGLVPNVTWQLFPEQDT